MKKFLSAMAVCFLATQLFSQQQDVVCYYNDPGKHERNRNIEVQHMKLEVSFAPAEGKVFGTVTHTFRCLQDKIDTIFLDGPGIQIKSATLDGKKVFTDSISTGIVVHAEWPNVGDQAKVLLRTPLLKDAFNQTHSLVLEYVAKPNKGIYFIGWKNPPVADPIRQSRRQIWTQGQGIDNRYWIPMLDDRGDKFVTEVFVQFDKAYSVLSNGDMLENKENKDGTKTWHYKINHQHAGYLLMLAIDKYAIKHTKTKYGTPINFWYYPEHPDRLEPSSLYSERIIEFLEEEIGVKYQWGAYSQVMIQDFLYGAMENTSATTFGDFFWVDKRAFLDRNYIGVNCHEATHQWFGDLITARNDADHWLQESFATYYPGLFTGSIYGADETPWYFRGSMNGALAAGEKNSLPVRNSEAGSPRHYPKGASVIYMLSHVMGRENFRRGIQLYLNRHGFSGVETRDLEIAMLDATGMNMDWFFDQWIYRGGEPSYKVSWQKVSAGTEFTVEQVHKMEQTVGVFKMPVDFAVYYTDGTVERQHVMVDKVFQKIIMPNTAGKTVDFTLFDEGSFVLKKVNFRKTLNELKHQLIKSQFMLDRYDALLALADTAMAKKRDILLEAYKTEPYKNIKAEIAKQLASNPADNLEFITEAYNSPLVEIRRAIINNLPANAKTALVLEKALKDSSYGIIETALLKLWELPEYQPKRASLLENIKDLDGYILSLRIRYLELGSDVWGDKKEGFVKQLASYCDSTYEFRTRINAMQALQRMNVCNEMVIGNLYNCLLNFNGRLNGPAKDVLAYFKQQSAFARMMRLVLDKGAYTDKEKKKIRQMLEL